MKYLFLALVLVETLQVVLGAKVTQTPSPIQPGTNFRCAEFEAASPGDTCYAMAGRNGLTLEEFLRINPPLWNAERCAANMLAGYYYCVKVKPLDLAGIGLSFTGTTKPPPTPTNCQPIGSCYEFGMRLRSYDKTTMASWCSSFLRTTVTSTTDFGLPTYMSRACKAEKNGGMSSICSCFTASKVTVISRDCRHVPSGRCPTD